MRSPSIVPKDGGGRELAYVKMSRAKDRSTVYAVADDVDQGREDLIREWSAERRPAWVIDSGTPATDPAAVEASQRVARPMRDALRRGRLTAEQAAIAAVIPPDPSAEIPTVEKDLRRIHRQREDLTAGTGRYADGPVGHAVWELGQAEMNFRPPRPGPGPLRRIAQGQPPVASGAWRLAGAARDGDTVAGGSGRTRGQWPRRRGGVADRAPIGTAQAGQPPRLGRRSPRGGPAPEPPRQRNPDP